MTRFTATIRHHSIARARHIDINGTLTEAKKAAAKEFGDEQRDYTIAIYDANDDYMVSSRKVGGRRWQDRD